MNGNAVVIVGGGQSGARVAALLRQESFAGSVDIISDETLPPYQRPPLSKSVLTGKQGFDACELYSAEFYEENAISLTHGTSVTAINCETREVTLRDGSVRGGGAVVIATGSRARNLALEGADLAGIHMLRTYQDSCALAAELRPGAHVVIVGGGFIGFETAASACELGCKVTVLEAAPKIFARSLPQEISEDIASLHKQHDVAVIKNAKILRFKGNSRVSHVQLQDGTLLPADVVVIGIGVIPNTELAAEAGIDCDDGILVDEYGGTSIPGIFAAGDCTRAYNPLFGESYRLESWQNADLQARTVAKSICGKPEPYAVVPWLWSDQFDWTLQMSGFPARGEQIIQRGSLEAGGKLYFCLKQDELVGVSSFCRGAYNAKDFKLSRTMLERNVRVDPAFLANESLSLRNIMKGS